LAGKEKCISRKNNSRAGKENILYFSEVSETQVTYKISPFAKYSKELCTSLTDSGAVDAMAVSERMSENRVARARIGLL
jgi:hypothetical protein